MTALPPVHQQVKLAKAVYAAHARLSPSGSKKWLSCPGSLTLEEALPNLPSDYSDNGTGCHIVAAECLRSDELHPSDWLMDRVKVSDEGEEPRYVEFTEDLCTMTTGYVDAIKALTKDRELHVEERVSFSHYIDVEDQFGTIDAYWLEPLENKRWQICICDLKSGFKFVATDSPQLKIYALAVLALFDLSHDIESVRLMIYQPRHGGMREEVISVAELLEFAKTVKEGARLAELARARHVPNMARGDIEIWERTYLNSNPNEEDCAFCRAMAVCPSARAKLEATVGAAFDVIAEGRTDVEGLIDHVVVDTDDAPVSENLGKLMSVTGFLEDWIKAVRAEVERRLMLDEPVAGFGLELGRQGARAWSDEDAAEKMVRETFRIKAELAYKMKLHSPTQLEKLSYNAKPTEKNPNPAKAVITERQWLKLCALIKRADPLPSVKPLSQIKELYRPTKPDADAFDVIPDEDSLY